MSGNKRSRLAKGKSEVVSTCCGLGPRAPQRPSRAKYDVRGFGYGASMRGRPKRSSTSASKPVCGR